MTRCRKFIQQRLEGNGSGYMYYKVKCLLILAVSTDHLAKHVQIAISLQIMQSVWNIRCICSTNYANLVVPNAFYKFIYLPVDTRTVF